MSTAASAVPEGRYGREQRRRKPRWMIWLAIAVAIIGGTVLAYLAYQRVAPAPISAERVAFEEKSRHSMEITIDVTRDDPSRPGVCIVRVRARSGAESGRKEIYVPPSNGGSRLSTVVRSGDRPVTADVFGCSYSVPPYLRPSG